MPRHRIARPKTATRLLRAVMAARLLRAVMTGLFLLAAVVPQLHNGAHAAVAAHGAAHEAVPAKSAAHMHGASASHEAGCDDSDHTAAAWPDAEDRQPAAGTHDCGGCTLCRTLPPLELQVHLPHGPGPLLVQTAAEVPALRAPEPPAKPPRT